jgi:hypothetical protein
MLREFCACMAGILSSLLQELGESACHEKARQVKKTPAERAGFLSLG